MNSQLLLHAYIIISGEGYFLAERGTTCADYNALYINDKRTCQSVSEKLKAINNEVEFEGVVSSRFKILGCCMSSDNVYLNRGEDGVGSDPTFSYQQICLSGWYIEDEIY